ncbi:MAG: hypothetical protein Q7S17_00895 [Xanthobacteraceae bacterium]|nr:hypothetical protein [Xanthobacteraceae bacterium]
MPSVVQRFAAPRSKVAAFTYDLSTATGSQAVTGVGFKPRAIIFMGAVSSGVGAWGMVGNDLADGAVSSLVVDTFYPSGDAIIAVTVSGSLQQAVVASYDADGFTLTWTKTGAPTGTATLYALCFE